MLITASSHRSGHNAGVIVTIGGIPLHPLLVHAVVVLLPLAALGAILVAVRPSWLRSYGPLVAAAALVGAISATGAVIAGNQLAAAIVSEAFQPVIAQHASFGVFTLWTAWPFAVLAIVTWVLNRRATRSPADGAVDPDAATVRISTRTATSTPTTVRVLAAASALVGIVAVVGTVLAGHSGSAAVWGYVTGS